MVAPLMKIGEAKRIAGTLSFPSKMPGTSYNLPAQACITGAKLAKIPGTACASCYALHGGGFYSRGNAVKGQRRRLVAINDPRWTAAMVEILLHAHASGRIRVDLGLVGVRLQRLGGSRWRYNEAGFHRWHDSGDIQSVEHFAKICEVARRTPKIKHWLPTQELGFVRRFLARGGELPGNLVVRVSNVMIDSSPRRNWPHTSSVFRLQPPDGAHRCPAPTQGNRCGDCRACWSSDVAHVAYELH